MKSYCKFIGVMGYRFTFSLKMRVDIIMPSLLHKQFQTELADVFCYDLFTQNFLMNINILNSFRCDKYGSKLSSDELSSQPYDKLHGYLHKYAYFINDECPHEFKRPYAYFDFLKLIEKYYYLCSDVLFLVKHGCFSAIDDNNDDVIHYHYYFKKNVPLFKSFDRIVRFVKRDVDCYFDYFNQSNRRYSEVFDSSDKHYSSIDNW